MKVFSVSILLAGLSLTSSLAEPSESLTEYGISAESLSSCNLELTDPSCGAASPGRAIRSPVAGYSQFVHDLGSPWYIDPCRHVGKLLPIDDDPSDKVIEDLLIHVTDLANKTLTQMKSFIGKYIEATHGVEYGMFQLFWESNCYDWLPSYKSIPKSLGDSLPQEYLNNVDKNFKRLSFNASLYMRIYGYGLAHIEEVQRNSSSPYAADFANAVSLLQRFQCDLEALVLVYNPEWEDLPPVDLDFLNDSNKEFDTVRDWIILREYMNALEWFIESVTYYTNFLQSFSTTVGS